MPGFEPGPPAFQTGALPHALHGRASVSVKGEPSAVDRLVGGRVRADGEVRTRDLLLGKETRYQLRHIRMCAADQRIRPDTVR
jgi:hypothetical protein